MIEIVTKGGKKIGQISDNLDQEDYLVIDGKRRSLNDVYASEELKDEFNKEVKSVTEDKDSDEPTGRDNTEQDS